MKKFIPYIFITAMISIFVWISFVGPFSGTILGPKKTEAGVTKEIFRVFGAGIYRYSGLGYLTDATGITNTAAWGDWGKVTDATIGQMLAWISSFTWYLSAKIFTLSGYLLDYAVDFSVKDFKQHIDQIKVIDVGYKIILNMANMIFIFILLYIAIKTILGEGGDIKKLLTNVIIVALLINFSLFMTKVLIDASNIVAMGFYNAVQTEVGKTSVEGNTEQKNMISVGSVSTAMMAGLKLQTQMPSPESSYNKVDSYKGLTNFNIAMNQFGGSALFLVSAFAFFSVAFLFVVRFVALLFYLLFSPIAFLGMISTELKEYSSKWWKGLQSQLIFAPAFLFMAYIISSIVNTGQLWTAVGGDKDSSSTFYDVISGSGQLGGFPIIMNYVILIALMIGGLITAKAMASQGSAGMVAYADKARGWMQGAIGGGLGRNLIGRGAYLASETNFIKKLEGNRPFLGGLARTRLESMAGASFGGVKGGYKKALDEKIKKQVARSKNLEYKGEDVDKLSKEIEEKETHQKNIVDTLLPKDEKHAKNLKKKYENLAGKDDEKLKNLKSQIEKIEKDYKTSGYYLSGEEDKYKKAQEEITQINLAKNEYNAAKDIYEERDTKNKDAKTEIINKKKSLDKLQNQYKKAYTTNLPFRSWLLSDEDKKNEVKGSFAFLDKILPSYKKAVAEIRKGKKTAKDYIEEAMKETGEKKEEKKA